MSDLKALVPLLNAYLAIPVDSTRKSYELRERARKAIGDGITVPPFNFKVTNILTCAAKRRVASGLWLEVRYAEARMGLCGVFATLGGITIEYEDADLLQDWGRLQIYHFFNN